MRLDDYERLANLISGKETLRHYYGGGGVWWQ